MPQPRLHIIGSTPIAAALERFAGDLGLDVIAAHDSPPQLQDGDLGIVVAAHGKGELEALRAALEAELPYVGLVASRKRGAGLVEELRAEGVSDEQLARLECPAGIEIGARTPPEIALAILARIIEVRRSGAYSPPVSGGTGGAGAPELVVDPICGMTVAAVETTLHVEHDGKTVYFCNAACKAEYEREHGGKSSAAPATAVDPICGMTVLAVPGTPHVEHDGETVYFCCDGCKSKFEEEHAVAAT